MQIIRLRHGGLTREGRSFGPVKFSKHTRFRRQPSSRFLDGLRPSAAVVLDPGEDVGPDWGLIVHDATWNNPRSRVSGVRVPLLIETGPQGTRYREALHPEERSHIAGGPRSRLQNNILSAGEAFASGVYHGAGAVRVVLDELYQYDDVALHDEPFAERYRMLRELIAEIAERNHDPLTMNVAAAPLHTGSALGTILASAPLLDELRYLVALDGMLDDPASRLRIVSSEQANTLAA